MNERLQRLERELSATKRHLEHELRATKRRLGRLQMALALALVAGLCVGLVGPAVTQVAKAK